MKSCGELIDDYRSNEEDARKMYASWISGFLSGTNSVCKKQMHPDWRGSEAFIRRFCNQNPLSSLSVGVYTLRIEAGGPASAEDCK